MTSPRVSFADESANASFEGAVECQNMVRQWGSQIRKVISHYSFKHPGAFTDEAPGIGRLENVREVVFPNIKVADYNYKSLLEFLQGTKLVNVLSSHADEDKAIITILRNGVNWDSFVDIHAYPCQAVLEWAYPPGVAHGVWDPCGLARRHIGKRARCDLAQQFLTTLSQRIKVEARFSGLAAITTNQSDPSNSGFRVSRKDFGRKVWYRETLSMYKVREGAQIEYRCIPPEHKLFDGNCLIQRG